MGDEVTRKGLLITGGSGTGKTRLARKIAEFMGDDTAQVIDSHELTKSFLFSKEPSIIIVEGCKPHDIGILQQLVTSEQITYRRMHREDTLIPSPHVIATSLYDINDAADFIHISLGGELPCPTR